MSGPKHGGRVAITIIDLGYDYAAEIAELEALGFSAEYIPLQGTKDARRVYESLRGFDYALIGPETWSEETFSHLPDIKMLGRLGTGMDSVDLHAATVRGIPVCNTPGANACSVAQYALAFMMDLSTRMTAYDREVRSGAICRRSAGDVMGSTVGLVGFGNIAKQLARLLRGFDVRILASATQRNREQAGQMGVECVTLDALARQSDFISIHLPLNEQTRGLIGREFFDKMKPTAFLVNTSRAGVVDEDSLVRALQSGRIAGAGLDVVEDLGAFQSHPLSRLENVVVTPYVAYSSRLGNRRTMEAAIKSLREFASGAGRISNLLNPDYIRYLEQLDLP